MADTQNRPASPEVAPQTSRSYERANPNAESGMGRLDTNSNATPTDSPDQTQDAVNTRQPGARQLNGHDVTDSRASSSPQQQASQPQPDHSMLDEEPEGWDQAPQDISNPRYQRQPKTDGKGGTD